LANMVALKWKERSNSNMKIDENWLRFYWQVTFILSEID
jgi:serine/threonine-protein kinase TTK/MPS1